VEQVIRRNLEGIKAFHEDEQAAFLMMSQCLSMGQQTDSA